MDSGALRSGPDDEEDLDLSLTPSAEEIIWLMDELTCREVLFILQSTAFAVRSFFDRLRGTLAILYLRLSLPLSI